MALLVLTFVAYLPALRAGWIWDDDYYVTKNYNLRSVEGLKNIWTKFGLSNGGTPQYYPVTHTTFWAECHLWGLRPAGYHAVNILLHAANAMLIWLILKRLDVPGAWVAAAIFAVHPVHVESVAWVTERKNVLSGFFYLSAAYIYLFQFQTGKWKWYALAIVLFVLGLLSKSVVASLPAAILLVMWWKRGRITTRDVIPLLPMFALGLAMGILTSWMEREHVGAQGIEWQLSVAQRVLIAGRALWFYAMKLVLPVNLSFIYTRWTVNPHVAWQLIFPIAAIALVATTWMMRKRWGRGPLVALLLFGGTLLPALGFVDLLPMRYSFVADHFQYLASVPIIALLVVAAKKVGPVSAAIVLICLAALTASRTMVYRDIETLWLDTISKNPTGWMPRTNLASLLIAQGKFDDAQRQLDEARRFNPDQPEVLVNLAAVAEKRGRLQDAIDLYSRVIEKREDAVALTNAGRLFELQQRFAEAEELYRRAIAANPRYAPARVLMGVRLAGRGELERAADQFQIAVTADPASAEAWNNLGVVRERLGDVNGARDAYERALSVNPAFEKAGRNLERLRLVR